MILKRKAFTQQQTIVVIAIVLIVAVAGVWYFTRPTEEPQPTENKEPIVVASSDSYFSEIGLSIVFTAEGSRDPDGEIELVEWNLGDGNTKQGLDVTHTYELPGYYVVTVEVTDDDGATTSNDVQPIFIKVERPEISPTLDSPLRSLIGVSQQIIKEGETVLFNGKSSYGWKDYRGDIVPDVTKISDFSWDFGDDSTSNEAEATHDFGQTGNYVVTLTVTDATDQTDTSVRTIRVLPPGVDYEGEIKNPDTLVLATDLGITSSLDIWRITGGNVGRQIAVNVGDFLVWTGPGDIEPQSEGSLSERWEISDDGMQYTFYLREGIEFWDGQELTAEDVEYTYKRMMALGRARGIWGLLLQRLMGVEPGNPVTDEQIQNAVEVIDTHTVRFNFALPYAPFLMDLAYPSTCIIQKDYAIENGAWSWERDKTIDYASNDGVDKPMEDGEALMCTGPYIPGEWSKAERLVFTRNENYWQGVPEIEFVRFITVPEWSTRKLMVQIGDVDGIAVATPEEFEQMVGAPGVKPILVKYGGFVEVMYFGFNSTITPPEHQVPKDFFSDVHMRRAFAYAFPYDKYIDEIWLGYAEEAKGVLPSGFLGAYDNFPYYYDLEKAEEELKLAWDGKYYEEGFQVALAHQTWAAGTHGAAYMMWAEEFAKIDPKFKLVPVGTTWSTMLKMPTGMLVAVIGLDPVWYRNVYHSDYGFAGDYGYRNELVNELIVKSTETPFIEERLPLLQEAMDIVADECPALLTVYNPHFVVFKDYVDGYWYQINHIDEFGYWFDMSKGG